ncbi:MAG: glycosyltransferase, partial [Thermoproteus sp.]
FAFSLIPQAEHIVPHGLPPCTNVDGEKTYDFAVAVDVNTDLPHHMWRKNIPLVNAVAKSGKTICTPSAARAVKCDAYTEPPLLYTKARYALVLSHSEGFGLPAAEAMSCGTPVIYLDAPAVNEFAVGYRIPAVFKGYKRDWALPWAYGAWEPAATVEEIADVVEEALGEEVEVEYRRGFDEMAEEICSAVRR